MFYLFISSLNWFLFVFLVKRLKVGILPHHLIRFSPYVFFLHLHREYSILKPLAKAAHSHYLNHDLVVGEVDAGWLAFNVFISLLIIDIPIRMWLQPKVCARFLESGFDRNPTNKLLLIRYNLGRGATRHVLEERWESHLGQAELWETVDGVDPIEILWASKLLQNKR